MIRWSTILLVLLIVGCVHWNPTVWEFDMPLNEFQEKNDRLILIRMTADTVIYARIEHYDIWNNRNRYYTYVFVEGNLAGITKAKQHPLK